MRARLRWSSSGGINNESILGDTWLISFRGIIGSASAQQISIASAPHARFGHSSVLVGSTIFMCGGAASITGRAIADQIVWALDMSAGAAAVWRSLSPSGPAVPPRVFAYMAPINATSAVLAFGWTGVNNTDPPLGDTQVLTVGADGSLSWRAIAANFSGEPMAGGCAATALWGAGQQRVPIIMRGSTFSSFLSLSTAQFAVSSSSTYVLVDEQWLALEVSSLDLYSRVQMLGFALGVLDSGTAILAAGFNSYEGTVWDG